MTAIVVMGVSGCGKTTIGRALADQLGCPFFDADDFHPPENIEKMANGIPLTDTDRAPWLSRLQALIHRNLADGVILACSALKRRYRDQLREGNDRLQFVYLHGDFDTIWSRMQSRHNHYMKPDMLHSQFATLEPPGPDEAIRVDITDDVVQIVEQILNLTTKPMNPILTQLGHLGVIPVVVLDDAAHAQPLGQALRDGGLPCAEITFRTAAAQAAIRTMSAAFPDMLVGAGTVLTIAQAETAVAAGAKFIVTPGFDVAVVDWCLAHDILITPGVMTPTEINMALNKGLNILKFFPAEAAGGIKTLKAIAAPYGGVKFIPTGGITPANLPDYLRLPSVHACGGSWLVEKKIIANGEFEKIKELAGKAVEIVKNTRH